VLLECEDQALFMWFMQREQPADVNMQRILQIIRESRQKS